MHTLVFSCIALLMAAAFQPADPPPPSTPPLVLAFYYPWYGSPDGPGGTSRQGHYVHWEGVDPASRVIASSTHYPKAGAYDSLDPATIERHCGLARDAGVDGLIISWWGKKSYEARSVGPVLDACARHGLKACIYFEQVPKGATPEAVASELSEVLTQFGSHAAWLTVSRNAQERPVLFIYGRALSQLGLDGWKTAAEVLRRRAAVPPVIIADDFSEKALATFDGAHAYGPMGDLAAAEKKGESSESWAKRVMPWWANTPRATGRISCCTVFPGYDDTKVRTPGMAVDRRSGALYDSLWREAIAACPDWVLVTSFNEWHEGSEIEPSDEFGDSYIRATAGWAAKFRGAALRPHRPGP